MQLTANQVKTIQAIAANYGKVPNCLEAFKAAGVDGRTLPGLLRRKLVTLVFPDLGTVLSHYELTDLGREYL